MPAENHTIVPPADEALRARLKKKLEEYEERLKSKGQPWEYQHPELAHKLHANYRDARYKADVLKAILDSKDPVDTHALSQVAAQKYGENFNVNQFCNACGVIAAYCGDSTQVPSGGTGLPSEVDQALPPTPTQG